MVLVPAALSNCRICRAQATEFFVRRLDFSIDGGNDTVTRLSWFVIEIRAPVVDISGDGLRTLLEERAIFQPGGPFAKGRCSSG
jgi:hypothetical protein